VHTIKKKHGILIVVRQEIGIEINAYKTKYVGKSGDQNAGRRHKINTDNSSFVRVEEFKYLGTNLTNQNSIQEEIKSRLKFGNACYHLVQNILSPSLQLKNMEIRIHRTVILPVVLFGYETW